MVQVKLSVIIPVYNEENRLPKTLRAIDEYLRIQDYGYEIVVVSDGSQDRTREVVNELAQELKNLRVIGEQKNYGKGYSVREGMLEAKGEYRVFLDADNSTSIDHVKKMWPEFKKGFEVIIGSRDIKGALIAVRQPWWRQRLGDLFNLIVQIVSGLWGIWDTQCGFKGFSAKSAQEIFSRATINRWAFDVEVLIIAKKLGYTIKEIPVTWINDKESKVKFSGMVRMLLEVLQITLNKITGKYNA
ncbi:MAG: dolichyl-phosphate beta-glucosyltransferase [Patescibacteria group bacterium]